MTHTYKLGENQNRIVATPKVAETDHIFVGLVETSPLDEIPQASIGPREFRQSSMAATPSICFDIGRFDTVLTAANCSD